MEKLSIYELRNVISSLHKREDFHLVERLAKFVEKMNIEIVRLQEENESLKSKMEKLYEIDRIDRDVNRLEREVSDLRRSTR